MFIAEEKFLIEGSKVNVAWDYEEYRYFLIYHRNIFNKFKIWKNFRFFKSNKGKYPFLVNGSRFKLSLYAFTKFGIKKLSYIDQPVHLMRPVNIPNRKLGSFDSFEPLNFETFSNNLEIQNIDFSFIKSPINISIKRINNYPIIINNTEPIGIYSRINSDALEKELSEINTKQQTI